MAKKRKRSRCLGSPVVDVEYRLARKAPDIAHTCAEFAARRKPWWKPCRPQVCPQTFMPNSPVCTEVKLDDCNSHHVKIYWADQYAGFEKFSTASFQKFLAENPQYLKQLRRQQPHICGCGPECTWELRG